MSRDEVIDLLELIDESYPGKLRLNNAEGTINRWYEALKKEKAERITTNFQIHLEESDFVPSIASLLRKPPVSRFVPGPDETMAKLQKKKAVEVSEAVREAEKAKIRKILGIE